MSNYLRNVANRAAGASLLRPRVPSRFEPVGGMTPAMDHFREMVTERVAEAPRVTHVSEARPTPAPTSSRVSETPLRREPPTPTHTVEERPVNRKKPEIDQPRPLPESRTQTDSLPSTPTIVRGVRPEITQEPVNIQAPVSRRAVAENVQPGQEPTRPTVQIDVPVAVSSTTPQFPAPTPERRPERRTPVTKTETQIRNRELPVTPAPAPHAEPTVFQTEIAAPSIHVTIGKVIVQATLPSTAPVHAPVRAPAHNGPRLTLERYLDRRGGRL